MPAGVAEIPVVPISAIAQRRPVIVCAGTGCAASGSGKVFEAFRQLHAEASFEEGACPHREVTKSGCQGFCQMGPLVTILPEGVFDTRVKPQDVPEIAERTLANGEVIERLLYRDSATKKTCRGTDEIPFYKLQTRFVLKDCGYLDPESLEEYVSIGGYDAAKLAYTK